MPALGGRGQQKHEEGDDTQPDYDGCELNKKGAETGNKRAPLSIGDIESKTDKRSAQFSCTEAGVQSEIRDSEVCRVTDRIRC